MRAFNLKFTRQKMKKYLILLATAFILSACSSPLNIQNARNKELLAYTSKFEIKHNPKKRANFKWHNKRE